MTRELLQQIARPRLFGTAGAKHVHQLLHDRLTALGLAVETRPFEFSTWPGHSAVPALGGFLMIVFAAVVLLLLRGDNGPAALLLAGVIVVLLPAPILAGWAVDQFPIGRAAGANMIATRPGSVPRFLVVAHRDSKSQPVPLGLRVAAAAVIVFTLPATGATAVFGATAFALALALAGAAGAGVLVFCAAANNSPGALDNASGLAALLDLAAQETSGDVGFLVTDAEELGLAGSRAAARELSRLEAVINLDGLDDDGPFRLLAGRGPGARQRARALRDTLEQAARDHGAEVRTHRVPAGLMVDHLPFAAAGVPALTIMRGHADALVRVHQAGDSADRLTGRGAAEAARVVGSALAALRTRPATPGQAPA